MAYMIECNDGRMRDADNSRLLDIHRHADFGSMNELVDRLYATHFADLPLNNKAKLKKHVKLLIVDFYASWIEDLEQAISIPLGKSSYKAKSRYNALHISETMIAVVNRAIESGLLNYWKGHATAERTSRFWATLELQEEFLRLGSFPSMLETAPDYEPIILRDVVNGRKVDVEYDDARPKGSTKTKVAAARAQLQVYNSRLRNSFIDIPSLDDNFIEIDSFDDDFGTLLSPAELARKIGKSVMLIAINAKTESSAIKAIRQELLNYRHKANPKVRPKGKNKRLIISQHDKCTRRIFNNGTFAEGGRFYGGWWQRIPASWRKRIWIDNQSVIEVDFSAFHIVILYAQMGIDYYEAACEDPYCLNLPDLSESLNDAVILELIQQLRDRHPLLANKFCSNVGVRLMNIDSEIAAMILARCLEANILPLIIHDSFIVQVDHSETLLDFMMDAVNEMFGITPSLKQAIDQQERYIDNFGDDEGHISPRYRHQRALFARIRAGDMSQRPCVLIAAAHQDVANENQRKEFEELMARIDERD